MDNYGQGRPRAPFSRARPRSRFTDNTLSTINNDTISSISMASAGWTDSEDEYHLPSPTEPANPFFRSPRPAPEDVFRFGRRRGLAHFMKPEVQNPSSRPLQRERERASERAPEFELKPEQKPRPKPEVERKQLEPERKPKLETKLEFERKHAPGRKSKLEPEPQLQSRIKDEEQEEDEKEESTPEPTIQILSYPPPKTKLTTNIIVPQAMGTSQPNDLEERFRTVSASLEDTKEAIDRMEKVMLGGISTTPPPSPHIHISFSIPRNPFGRYQPFVLRIFYVFLLWLCCESTLCAIYCKPEYSSKIGWKPYDPFFGQAIPWKLDDWTGFRVSRTWRDYWNY